MENKQLNIFTKIQLGDYVVPITEAGDNGGKYTEAYPIGFFNGVMKGGVRAGDLIVITGKSGDGKTMLAMNITLNLDKISIPTLWFSYEVSLNNLLAKFKQMGISDKTLIYTPKKNITGNVGWIKEKIIEAQQKYSVKVIFIDDLTFLTPTTSKNSDQYRMVIGNICQELKFMSVDLNIVIFLMAHVKKTYGREIEMEDTAESSAPFQKCDYMMAIRRADKDENWGGATVKNNTIKLLKNRPFGDKPSVNFSVFNSIIYLEKNI